MRNSIALLCALIMTCLTGLVHASHLKGGSVTWKRDAGAPGFVVEADVIINFDLSAGSSLLYPVDPSFEDIPKVNGHPFYKKEDIVGSDVSLSWGDGSITESFDRFEVVTVDPAAQIVTARAIKSGGIKHPYTWSGAPHYDIRVLATARDDAEELANRVGTDLIIQSRVKNVEGNTPPSFDPELSNLVIVDKGTEEEPVVTFHVPVASDPDAGDTVKYSFIERESDASNVDIDGHNTPWEKLQGTGMSITEAGVISWNTALIGQTIKTRCIQVVARDYAPGSTVAKSSTTLEFQVWVDDTTQTGVPEIVVAPATQVIYVHPDEQGEFRVIGFDHGENSRLKLIYDEEELPEGAVILPTAGFAGDGHDNEGDYLTCYFSWKPTAADLDDEYTMHFKFEDEDGFQSDEVAATVVVVPAPPGPLEPLELEVSQLEFVMVPQGTLITFTATGTCATSAVPVALTTYSDIPHGATFTPVLPAHGTSSVTSTFTWQTEADDFTHPSHPIEIEVVLTDAYRRETKQTVSITLLNPPPPPVVTLAAGTVTPIPATAWDTLVVNFNATGGTHHNPRLTANGETAGDVEMLEEESPASGRLVWRVVPGQLRDGMLRIRVYDEWGSSSVLEVPIALAGGVAPAWWDSSEPAEDVLTGGTPMDFSMANHGQLKAIASRAYAKLSTEFPAIATLSPAGEALAEYVDRFDETDDNYEPLLQGELKHAASLFFDAMGAATGKGNLGYPWARDSGSDHHYSPATVGQVKMAFIFPHPLRGVIFNEPPSSVVITSPVIGTTLFGEQEIDVEVSATDIDGNIDQVEFFANGVSFAIDRDSPYEATFPESPLGTYDFTAKATDLKGLSRTSSVVTVEIVSGAPSAVAITSPTPGAQMPAGQSVTVAATASDPDNNIARVEFYEGASLFQVINDAGAGPYEVQWNQSTPGVYELRAKVIDADENELMSAPVEVTRNYNPSPSFLTFGPAENSRFPLYPSSATVPIDAGVYDSDGVSRIEFHTGPDLSSLTLLAGFDATSPVTTWGQGTTWTPAVAGNYVIQVKAYDIYGATQTSVRNVTVVAPTTVSLQEGVGGYTGMVDTYIRGNAANQGTNYGNSTTLSIRETNPSMVGLLKWDLNPTVTGIPATAKVLAASMTLNITTTASNATVVRALTTEWTELGAKWNVTGMVNPVNGSNIQWNTAGAGTSDYSATSLGTLFIGTGAKVATFNNDGVAKVQQWMNGEVPNHGVRLQPAGTNNAKEMVASSSEATTASQRPMLTIIYY